MIGICLECAAYPHEKHLRWCSAREKQRVEPKFVTFADRSIKDD